MTGFDTSPEFFDTVRNPLVRERQLHHPQLHHPGDRQRRDQSLRLGQFLICNNTVINAAAVNHSGLYLDHLPGLGARGRTPRQP
jgi:hypothetical protein